VLGKASLGQPDLDGKVKARKEDVAAGSELLGHFLSHQAPAIGTARGLALKMAGLTYLVRDAVLKTLEREGEMGTLKGWLATFEKTFLPYLPPAEFADMYAQTLAYGLVAAKALGISRRSRCRRSRIRCQQLESEAFPLVLKFLVSFTSVR
jgi:hypothetical protein